MDSPHCAAHTAGAQTSCTCCLPFAHVLAVVGGAQDCAALQLAPAAVLVRCRAELGAWPCNSAVMCCIVAVSHLFFPAPSIATPLLDCTALPCLPQAAGHSIPGQDVGASRWPVLRRHRPGGLHRCGWNVAGRHRGGGQEVRLAHEPLSRPLEEPLQYLVCPCSSSCWVAFLALL